MIELERGMFLVQTVDDLRVVVSALAGRETGFLDLETTSRNPKLKSVNPWHNCWIAGFAITAGVDEDIPTFYIPVGHATDLFSGSINLPMDAVASCIKTVTESWKLWANNNIKYDMHVLQLQLGWCPDCTVEDLQTVAKIHNSDRFLYNQTVLAEEYAGYSIVEYEKSLEPYKVGNQDYGRIPVDVMGPYACMDVRSGRDIWNTLNRLLDPELDHVRMMERAVTRVLFDTEQEGLHVNPSDIRVQRICAGHELLLRGDRLANEIKFPGFNVASNKDMNEYFVNRLGLPVVKWTNEDDDEKESNPSFSKDAMTEYLVHPRAPVHIVREILELKKLAKFHSAFLKPWDELNQNGNTHPDYNQLVRTGRMSCKKPSAQVLDKPAKKLIIPRPGCSFLNVDQSQVEFRVIVHFIKDVRCIAAYKEDMDTDYHQWVSEIAHTSRKAAKTINFLIAFGGGKAKLLLALVKDPTIVGSIKDEADAMAAAGAPPQEVEEYFNKKAAKLALQVYNSYIAALPTLKRSSYAASDAARQQGYVRTLYKRRRHIQANRAHIAFNSAVQGTAADLIKDNLVRLAPLCKDAGVNISAVVHDSVLFHGPHDVVESEDFLRAVLSIMEKPEPLTPLRVPIRCSYGYSRLSWADADDNQKTYPKNKSDWHRNC